MKRLILENGLWVPSYEVKGWNGTLVEGGELSVGDWCFLTTKGRSRGDSVDLGLAYLLGYVYGDGHVNAKGDVDVLWRREQSNREELVTLSKKFLGGGLYEYQRPGHVRMECCRKYRCPLFQKRWSGLRGKSALNKRVNWQVFEWSLEGRGQFVAGLLDSDGCVRNGEYICLATASEMLARSFQELLWTMGIYSIVRRIKSPTTMAHGSGLMFRVSINSLTSRKLLYKLACPHVDYKRNALRGMIEIPENGNSERNSLLGLGDYLKTELKQDHLKFHPEQNSLRNLRAGRVSLVSLKRLDEYAPDWVDKRPALRWVIQNGARMEKVVKVIECEGRVRKTGEFYRDRDVFED